MYTILDLRIIHGNSTITDNEYRTKKVIKLNPKIKTVSINTPTPNAMFKP